MIIKIGKYELPKRDPADLVRSINSLCDMVVIDSSLNIGWWITRSDDEVVVEVNGEVEFRGRISTFTDITKTGTVHVVCRDKTSDLVDCPHIGAGEFKGVTPLQILKKVVQPFDIKIQNSLDSSPIPFFGHSLDEKSHEIIRRLGQSVGWIITSDGQSSLVHWGIQDSNVVEQIVQGINGDFRLKYDKTKAYSFFKALGQGEFGRGQFQLVKQLSGESNRYRPHIFITDKTTDVQRLGKENQRIKDYIQGGRVSAEISYYGNKRILPGQKIFIKSKNVEETLLIQKAIIQKRQKTSFLLEGVLPERFGGES